MDKSLREISPQSHFALPELVFAAVCFLTVASHSTSLVFLSVAPSATWFLSLTYYYAARVAIPVLMMIFGFTMLERQEDYRQIFLRFVRTGMWLLLFSAVWYLAGLLVGKTDNLSLRAFASSVLRNPVPAYRYVYTYMGLILMLPFLQKLAAVMERKDFHVFFLMVGVVCGLCPMLGHYIPQIAYPAQNLLPLFGGSVGMLFAGCYARRYFTASNKWRVLCAAGFVFLCLLNVGLTYLEYIRTGGEDYMFYESVTCLPIMAEAVCLFYVMLTAKPVKRIRFPLSLVFGFYMISGLAARAFQVGYYRMVSWGVHPLVSLLAFQIFVFALSGAAAWILKKIPGIKALL